MSLVPYANSTVSNSGALYNFSNSGIVYHSSVSYNNESEVQYRRDPINLDPYLSPHSKFRPVNLKERLWNVLSAPFSFMQSSLNNVAEKISSLVPSFPGAEATPLKLNEEQPFQKPAQDFPKADSANAKKRETTSVIVSEKTYIAGDNSTRWERMSSCISDTVATFFGVTSTNQTVEVFYFQNNSLVRNATASQNINAVMPARIGTNYIASTCEGDIAHLITSDSALINPPFFHTTIANQALKISQYSAVMLFSISQGISHASRPAVGTNYSAIAAHEYFDIPTGYYINNYFETNNTGYFSTSPFFFHSEALNTGDRYLFEIITEQGGSGNIFQMQKDALYVKKINESFLITDETNTNLSPGIFNQTYNVPFGPRKPLLAQVERIGLIHQLLNLSTAFETFDKQTNTIIATRILNDTPAERVANATVSIEHCPQPQRVNAHAYARQVANGIKFDLVDTLDGASLFGGEQLYTDYNISSSPQQNVGCHNQKFILNFLDNGRPVYVEVDIPLPAPLSTPVGGPQSSNLTLVFNILPKIDQYIPITGEIIVIGTNIINITLKDPNGYDIVNTTSHLPMPVGVTFRTGDIFEFSVNPIKAIDGTVPDFEGCTSEGECTGTVPGTQLENLFGKPGPNLGLWIGVTAAGVGVLGFGAVALYLRFRKQQEKRIKRNDEINATAAPSFDDMQRQKMNQESQQMWTSGNVQNQDKI